MKKGDDFIDKMLKEVTEIGKMRRKEGEGEGITSHDEIMASILLLLFDSVSRLKKGIFALLGVMLAFLVDHLLE